MATLDVPLHLPVRQSEGFLRRELRFSHVTSVKLCGTFMRIEHEKMTSGEIIREIDGLHEPLTFV